LNLVDLHTHTTESDGTLEPVELVREAAAAGIRVLAITDHDTVSRSEAASAAAQQAGIELIRGIELSCKHAGKSVHLLGYFFNGVPLSEFEGWLRQIQESRRDRNRRLALRLQELGLDVQLEDAEKFGRGLTGRPHFARVLVQKGYVKSLQEAFHRYLGESAPGYVERDSPDVPTAIRHMTAAGAVPSLAHPIRVGPKDPEGLEQVIAGFAAAGLPAIEAFHSDHTEADTQHFIAMAQKYGMAVSGGSDFHGANKPGIQLGSGLNGNLRIPEWVVPALRDRSR
jgi:3',5'-nucleoside bisphosphate phosphatase